MIIESTRPGMFFTITYLAAFLVAAGMMAYQGLKKGYPLSAWFLIILSGVIFFIIGDKVFTYFPEQWTQVFTRFHFPETDKKTVLGGIIGAFTGILLAKTLLRFNRPVLDTLAVGLPLAMAISRVGCLMAGCCFGTPTNLPWGIQYDAASWVYQVHMAQGLVHLHDGTSVPVHPAQLYQMAGCLLIAFLAWRSQKQWKSSGSQFLFSVLCYAVLRFFVEFVRAPETNFFTGQFFWGLKTIQWLILGIMLPMALTLIFRELKTKPFSAVSSPIHVSDLRQILLTIFLSILVFTGRKWFDPLELSTIMVFLFPFIIALFVKAYQRFSVAGFRWVVPVMFVCCISFMAQKSSPTGKEDEKITFTSVGLTGMAGTYYEMFEKISKEWIPAIPASCNNWIGTPGHWSASSAQIGSYQSTFWQGGIDVAYNKWRGKYYKFILGGKAFVGGESGGLESRYPTTNTFGLSPYVRFDWRWVGVGGGFTVGQMKLSLGHKDIYDYNDGDVISSDYRNMWFLPFFSFRAGPVDILYAEAGLPMFSPSTSPMLMAKTGIGSGLGKSNGTKVSVGYCYPGIYAQAVFPIKNKLVLEGLYADNFLPGNNSKRVLSFGISYRFSVRVTTSDSLNSTRMSRSSRTFTKLHGIVRDVDGNVYHTIALGARVWMAENLKVTRFRDGSKIPDVTNDDFGSDWRYNWNAINHSTSICPAGWHIPSLGEWTSLINSLGGKDIAGNKLEDGFSTEGKVSQWWSSTEQDTLHGQCLYLNNQTVGVMFTGSDKTSGLSVRCTRDY